MKIKKKIGGGGSGRGGGEGGLGWGGGQSGKEWRSGEAFVKIKKKNISFFFLGGGGVGSGGGGGRVGGGQGGWERRIEAFVKIRVRSGVGVGKVGVARFWVDG